MIFEIPEHQEQKVNQWISHHKCKYKNKPIIIEGRCSYVFIPIGLGLLSKVQCICGKEYIIEDDNF